METKSQDISSSLKLSLKSELKRSLLDQIKPSSVGAAAPMYQYQGNAKPTSESLEEFSRKYIRGTGGSEYEDKYHIRPELYQLGNGAAPLNKLPLGYAVPVFNNGKWEFGNPSTRVDGLVVPSGLNLSGGGKKKLSRKSRAILEHTFNMKVDE